MIDSLAARTLAALRNLPSATSVQNDIHIVPEVYFSWDAQQADVSVDVSAGEGYLMEAKITVSGQPRWLGLNVGLGNDTLNRGDQIVIVLDLAAETAHHFQLALISARDGTRIDTLLEEPVTAQPKGLVRTVIHHVLEEDAHAGEDAFHTLAIRLPAESHSLRLNDLRMVVLPRAKGVRATPATLSDFA